MPREKRRERDQNVWIIEGGAFGGRAPSPQAGKFKVGAGCVRWGRRDAERSWRSCWLWYVKRAPQSLSCFTKGCEVLVGLDSLKPRMILNFWSSASRVLFLMWPTTLSYSVADTLLFETQPAQCWILKESLYFLSYSI